MREAWGDNARVWIGFGGAWDTVGVGWGGRVGRVDAREDELGKHRRGDWVCGRIELGRVGWGRGCGGAGVGRI